jgi:uncharacterized membrane protein YgcG
MSDPTDPNPIETPSTSLAMGASSSPDGQGLGGGGEMDDELSSQVDSLLRDIEESTASTQSAMQDPPPENAVDLEAVRREAVIAIQAHATAEPAGHEVSVASAMAELDAEAAPEAVSTKPAAQHEQSDDLLTSVQAALQADPPSPPRAAAPVRAATAMNVAALDAQIASSTDALLESEEAQTSHAGVEAVAAATVAPVAAAALAAVHAPKSPPAQAPGPSSATKSAQVQASVAHAASTLAPAAKLATARGKQALGVLEGPLLGLMRAISKPLEKKPRVWRDSVGYLAASTCFFAAVLWANVLFLRKPANAQAEAKPFDFAKSGLPAADLIEHGHGQPASGGHGAKSEAGGHGGGGGGGHGAGAGAEKGKGEAKKPVLNSTAKKSVLNSTIDDAKKSAKDKDKKDAGGGSAKSGGH